MPSNVTEPVQAEQGLKKLGRADGLQPTGEKKSRKGVFVSSYVYIEVWMKLSRGCRGVFAISDRASSMIFIHRFHLQLTSPEFTRVSLAIQPNVVTISVHAPVYSREIKRNLPQTRHSTPASKRRPKTLAAE